MDGKQESGVKPLLTQKEFCALLGGISERKFYLLRAAGLIPDPLELGPRCHRWTQADFESALQRLPRRETAPEPDRLSEGRQARIEAMKKNHAR